MSELLPLPEVALVDLATSAFLSASVLPMACHDTGAGAAISYRPRIVTMSAHCHSHSSDLVPVLQYADRYHDGCDLRRWPRSIGPM
jgi:hypothetical protein